MRLARRLRAQRLESQHSLSHYAALATVDRHGPISPGHLAGQERIRPPSMTRIIAYLEAEGLLRREAHPTDGRQHLLLITRQGRELLAADRRRRDAWLSRQLAGLSEDEIEALAKVLPILERLSLS
jgi:DNA-binding MarR family transcriptional regulator